MPVRGRVRDGRIELETTLPEGAEVVVLPVGQEVPFDLDETDVAELEDRMAEAGRGNVVSAANVLSRLRR